MFSKILIANRGEIAVRIIKTCRRMGIKTVVVYSEADADSLAVEMADEAVAIGPPPAAQSYLLADRIIQACKDTGAQAVHPGFGFLSEKAEFAQACADAGIVFIGPNPHAIAAMGDKIESKKAAARAGVTTVPGHVGEIADMDSLRVLECFAMAERHFAVEVPTNELDSVATVGDIIRVIAQARAPQAPRRSAP